MKNLINNHAAATRISNGEEFTVTLTNGTEMVFLACVNTYGLDEVDFIAKYCYNTAKMNATSTNVGGWNATELRSSLNNSFFGLLPQSLRDVISEKTLQRAQGSSSTTLISASDKIWLPTETEVFGQASSYGASTETAVQHQYPVFPDTASRIKGVGSSGSAVSWWESSPEASNSVGFCKVSTTGTPHAISAGYEAEGVLPCFRIAPDQ